MDLLYHLKPSTQEETLFWEGEPVLTVCCQRPTFSALGERAARRVNRYYHRAETLFLRKARTRIYQRAGADLAEKRAASRPFTPWQASLAFQAQEQEDLLCVTLCYTLCQGEERTHQRTSAVLWDLSTGFPASLRT